VAGNGAAEFVNFNLPQLSPENLKAGKYKPESVVGALDAELQSLAPVKLAVHDPPTAARSAAAAVYRSLPKKLSELGLFEGPLAKQQPAKGVELYDLNTPLFSDYAAKRRFIRLPAGTTMKYQEQGVLGFPVGTMIAKTFSYPHDMRDASRGERLLETRIELLREDGWYGVTYVWNDEQTEVELALGGSEARVSWVHSDGQPRTVDYQIPNANQCLNCHRQGEAFVPIGPTARNMNRPLPAEHTANAENQLEHFTKVGMLADMPEKSSIAARPRADDPHSGSRSDRARAWLDVNCAHCHSPGGTARTSGLDLRWDQTDLAKLGVWKNPVAAGHGSGGRKYDIVPGKPDESILVYRLESEDPTIAIPKVGRRQVQEEAVSLVREWIAGMPARE
jgi:uncharacterized repeat protein (TIGR03806 family)